MFVLQGYMSGWTGYSVAIWVGRMKIRVSRINKLKLDK